MINNVWLIRASFLIALTSFFGSLYFSEILHYPPCVLCWYQRVCMYPLTVIYFVALWYEDKSYFRYSFPLSLIGLATASYHNLLYYGIVADSVVPCQQGISCTSKQVEIFGFLTIPLLSLIAFMLLTALGTVARWKKVI